MGLNGIVFRYRVTYCYFYDGVVGTVEEITNLNSIQFVYYTVLRVREYIIEGPILLYVHRYEADERGRVAG